MKIIKLKLSDEVKALLGEVSLEYRYSDSGFVEDLYCLMRRKGQGLPDTRRIEAMADHFSKPPAKITRPALMLVLTHRKMRLLNMMKTSSFKACALLADPIEAVRDFLRTFQLAQRKVQQSQCAVCKYNKTCQFGKQYGSAFMDMTKVVDPDFKLKVDPNCPCLPGIESTQNMAQTSRVMAQIPPPPMPPAQQQQWKEIEDQMALYYEKLETGDEFFEEELQEDSSFEARVRGGVGKSVTRFDATFFGRHIAKHNEDFIAQLSNKKLILDALANTIDAKMDAGCKTSFLPVDHRADEQDIKPMKSLSEISEMKTSQHALTDEMQDQKLKKKSLARNAHRQIDKRRRGLYILVDNSGSMQAQLGKGNSHGVYTCGNLASVFSASIVKKIRKEKGVVFFRFFAGGPGPLLYAEADHPKDEYGVIIGNLISADYNGGGTDIKAAIRAAVKDIQTADKKEPLAKVSLLVITDVQDNFNQAELKSCLGGLQVNILDVSGGQASPAQAAFQSVATKYFRLDPQEPDLDKMINLV